MATIALLDAHLEQISLCAASMAELSFPPPKIFTNALLRPHHITTLIRDTEVHERALFTVPPPEQEDAKKRRTTTFQPDGCVLGGSGPTTVRAPRRNTAVAAVLGGDLFERIRRAGGGSAGSAIPFGQSRDRGDIDVEVLLEGAERLLGVYPIAGAHEKIRALRHRHQRLATSIDYYERKVAEQAEQLSRMNMPRDFDEADDDEEDEIDQPVAEGIAMTTADMKREEEEVKELEAKKQILEQRVSAMEQDIKGVQR